MKIIAIRHGQTQWNLKGLFQGHRDSPLTMAGIQNIQKVAAFLSKTETIDCIVSSDLGRTLETAIIIAQLLQVPLTEANPLFRERCFGLAEGLSFSSIVQMWPSAMDELNLRTIRFDKVPNAEKELEFMCRVDRGRKYLKKNYAERTVLLVTHACVIEELQKSHLSSHEEGGVGYSFLTPHTGMEEKWSLKQAST